MCFFWTFFWARFFPEFLWLKVKNHTKKTPTNGFNAFIVKKKKKKQQDTWSVSTDPPPFLQWQVLRTGFHSKMKKKIHKTWFKCVFPVCYQLQSVSITNEPWNGSLTWLKAQLISNVCHIDKVQNSQITIWLNFWFQNYVKP